MSNEDAAKLLDLLDIDGWVFLVQAFNTATLSTNSVDATGKAKAFLVALNETEVFKSAIEVGKPEPATAE